MFKYTNIEPFITVNLYWSTFREGTVDERENTKRMKERKRRNDEPELLKPVNYEDE